MQVVLTVDCRPESDQITVTWWCCRRNKTGRLVFSNQNTVGERLEVARADHKILSPDCELDWNQVYVRREIKEQ
jgi:hypothetical protein